ncbi:glycosyltransferase [Carboxylicivirga sp. M1479]|uniref:glycosyltransferase n=1 Tax=Carboxylicivirga sp. M1479 TaxID=2594476 RepID=UPI00163DC4FA|nr:glycosyltransferase [Carboxylicivirga sp. M1479]
MKILYVADNLVMGGRERRMLELIKGLLSHGHTITLVLFRDAIHYKEVLDLPVQIIVLKKRYKKDVFTYFQLFKICNEQKPDLIHTWGGIPSVVAVPVAFFCKKKLINGMIANSVCQPFTKDWMRSRLSFPFSNYIVSNSNVGLKAYKVNKSKGVVIRNGFNLSRLNVAYDKSPLSEFQFGNKSIVGMIASINFRKDYPTFIKAALIVLEQRNDVAFVIIGEGDDQVAIKQMVPEKLAENFAFLGKQDNVDRYVQCFTMGVLATFAEGISNSVMEYMAFGKPVVASDVPGNRELVIDGETGLLVPVRDDKQMALKIIELLDNPQRAEEMGQRGAEVIKSRFSQAQMTSQYLKLYSNLIKNE